MPAMSFVTHLESTADATSLPARTLQTLHGGKPLLVRYDLDAVRKVMAKDTLRLRAPTLWRYRELLPLERDENLVTLGEGLTPLLPCPRLGAALGCSRLLIKDEGQLPTGSFKARGMALAVSLAKELGVTRVAIPSAGNAGGALAAYAARAGIECFAFVPEDTPVVNVSECVLHGAKTFLVDGLIGDCAKIVREGAQRFSWFDMSTLKEPYRIEGKKTMGLELAEQCLWRLPDAIFYPTGGGTGLIGMGKAWDELQALGWIEPGRRPRMYSCQAEGCAPIVKAFEQGLDASPAIDDPSTSASGLRVPKALGDFLVLREVRASKGRAIAGREQRIGHWMSLCARLEGIALCPESAICLDALEQALARGDVKRDDEVVVFNTGAAQKYVEVIRTTPPRLSWRDVDWGIVERAAG